MIVPSLLIILQTLLTVIAVDGVPRQLQQECVACAAPIPFDPNVHKPVYKVASLETPLLFRILNATFVEYLTATAGRRFDPPIRFETVPIESELALDNLSAAREVDFVLTGPGHSVCIEAQFGSRHLVNTVRTSTAGGETLALSHFAGVIMTRVDNEEINTITDLKDKVIAAGNPTGLGGAVVQFHQMFKAGMSFLNDPAAIVFTNSMGRNIKLVLDGTVDAGFARTRFLEPFAARTPGLNISDIKIIDISGEDELIGAEQFPMKRSTSILPEWQFSAYQHTPADVSREVQAALLAFEHHGKIGLVREACIEANINNTAQCDNLETLDPNTPCEASLDSIMAAASVLSQNDFLTYRTPISFNGVRKMLHDYGNFQEDPTADSWKCYRNDEFYDQITCPEGLFKLSPEAFDASCNSTGLTCPESATCICKPCFEALPIEVAPADDYAPGAGCDKMSICGSIKQNESINFTLVDNQKLDTGRNLRARALEDGGDTYITVIRSSSHTYSFSVSTSKVGIFILEIFDGDRQIEASPLRVRVEYRTCPDNQEATEDGLCQCKASLLALGGSCVELWLVIVCVLVPLIAIAAILLFFFVKKKEREANSLWIVNPSELKFGSPPIVLGRGSFGFVLEAQYRGSKVAVKRVLPPSKDAKSSNDTAIFGTPLLHGSADGADLEIGRSEHRDGSDRNQVEQREEARRGARSSIGTKTLSGQNNLKKMKNTFIEEMRVISKLRHPNITTVMGAVVGSGDPMLIMERMEHGSLGEVLENPTIVLEADLLLRIVKDIAHGVRFLHCSSPPVIHGDLKSGNVLIDSTFRAKLADFGMVKRSHATGTPLWMAPEILANSSNNTTKSDMYSVGVILNEIVSGKEPYHETADDLETILEGVADPKVNRRPEIPSFCPVKVKKLIMFLWHNDPAQRPTANELNNRLEDLNDRVFAPCAPKSESHRTPVPHSSDGQDFLYQAFPRHVADVLKGGGKVEPESHDCVSICFSDIVGFTTIASKMEPLKVSNMLDRLYLKFDEITRKHGLFKVETVGDAYMCAANLENNQHGDHAKRIALYAKGICQAASETLIDEDDVSLGYTKIRVGFHSGPVVSNVVGSLNPRYGLFGDSVNIAARMETTSVVGKIHCSEASAKLLKDQATELSVKSRGRTEIKGKGKMMTYWVA